MTNYFVMDHINIVIIIIIYLKYIITRKLLNSN